MDRKAIKTLHDILQAIHDIEGFFDKYPLQFEVYRDETLLRCAIHMNIAIIGEATNRLLKDYPEVTISNARAIVNTRNYIIHGYDSLRPEIIWAIVVNDLPLLKEEVMHIMADM